MSASYWLEDDDGNIVVDDIQITYNLSPMLRAAGLPKHGELVAMPTVEVAHLCRVAILALLEDPRRFDEMNPINGWGDYDGAVEFCTKLAIACARYPHAKLDASL
jgi:hypothetical protein